MKRYFKNLMIALFGNDPYRMELERVREEYEKTAEHVRTLDYMYDKVRQREYEADKALKASNGQVTTLQTLVENLRERVAEKDALVARMKEEFTERTESYKRRVADYSGQIARLQGELAKVRKRARAAREKKAPKRKEAAV